MACTFCSIVSGDIPATKIYEEDKILAFMDINPCNPGHVLIIPKQHYRNLFDFRPTTAGKIMEVGTKIASAIRLALNPDGLNLFQSNEKVAFQSVFHFHLHLIPRWEDDSLVLPWETKPGTLAEIQEIAVRIQEQLTTTRFGQQ